MVRVQISPGYVELWEACVTLGFMVALCIIAYSCDKYHEKGETHQEKVQAAKRAAAKAGIRVLVIKFGLKCMLEIGQGNPEPSVPKHLVLSEADVDMIMEYYGILLADP